MSKLAAQELSVFSEWFKEYVADQWDLQIERDAIAAGTLDHLAKAALKKSAH
jgi:hypothetical protein